MPKYSFFFQQVNFVKTFRQDIPKVGFFQDATMRVNLYTEVLI